MTHRRHGLTSSCARPGAARSRCRSPYCRLTARKFHSRSASLLAPREACRQFSTYSSPPDNLFGAVQTTVPELVLSPSAEQGYYLFLSPLSPGNHIIRWVAA